MESREQELNAVMMDLMKDVQVLQFQAFSQLSDTSDTSVFLDSTQMTKSQAPADDIKNNI